MSSLRQMPSRPLRIARQRGVSLFFALVCLVSVMLAAVALVRSVDTTTLIASNLAFQQSATSSADAGAEAAISWLNGIEQANSTRNVLMDADHPFNKNAPASGYYAFLDPAKSLTALSGDASVRFLWNDTDSKGLAKDSSGNTTRYIIQRICRVAGVAVRDAECLFGGIPPDPDQQNIKLPQKVCNTSGCPFKYQSPQIRITSRTEGPRNSISYVQVFVN